jgi:hypothetical protein
MYDEVKNESLSKKIRDSRKRNEVISNETVRRIKKQVYLMVRMPYLNLSDKVYYLISCTYFAAIVIASHALGSNIETRRELNILNLIDSVSSAIVPTAIIFLCGGHFYY